MFKWVNLLRVLEFNGFVSLVLKLEQGSDWYCAVPTGRTMRSFMSLSDLTSLQCTARGIGSSYSDNHDLLGYT